MDFHVGGRLRRSWGEKFTAVELYFYYNNSGVESDDEEGAAEETDFEEDPVEVRNRYLRGIRAKDPVQRKARGNDPLYDKDFVMNLFEMRTAWPVDWDRIDELNALVPQWATYAVTPQSLTRSYRNTRDEEINFVQWYRLWSLTCGHRFADFVLSDQFDDARVCESLPDLGILGQRLSRDAWRERWASYTHNDGRVAPGCSFGCSFVDGASGCSFVGSAWSCPFGGAENSAVLAIRPPCEPLRLRRGARRQLMTVIGRLTG